MAFEFYEKNLHLEIINKRRLEGDNYFSEPEIWYICYSIINAEKSFMENGYVHSDIQPKTCLINQQGHIKLIDNHLINFGKTAYDKVLYENY